MLAEAMSVDSGLQLVGDLNAMFLWLEVDSLELVHVLQGTHKCPWRLHYTVNSIQKLLEQHFCVITHVKKSRS